ncbi:hypothetical protein DITRI_Ditri02bG0110800 [Diplodiscus trichospermus]
MKQRAKRPKSMIIKPRPKLLFVIRIQGKNDMHPKTGKILYNLRLRKVFNGVFVNTTEGEIEILQKVEPYVTYGYESNLVPFGILSFYDEYKHAESYEVKIHINCKELHHMY